MESTIPNTYQHDSQNLLQALLGKSTKGRNELILQSSDGLALRSGPWKYITLGERSEWAYNRHNKEDTPLHTRPLDSDAYLFNLADDPGEMNNLAEEYPDSVDKFDRILSDIKQRYSL